jgi:hypothetical protein
MPKTRVDEYIEKQKSPQKEICRRLREIILRAIPDIKEEFKMGVPWYDGRYYLVALRNHVNMGFCIDGLSKEELSLLEGSGKTMRHIKFWSLKDIDEKKIRKLMKSTKQLKARG